MTIAYILADPGIGVFGSKGASVHVQEVIRAARALGHTVEVFAVRTDQLLPADLTDLPVTRVKVAKTPDTAERERAIRAAADELAQQVIARDDITAVYERYSLFSTAGSQAAAALNIPFILEVNAPLVDEQKTHRSLVDEAGAVQATRIQLEAATVISAVSQPVGDWAVTAGGDPRRLFVRANGVNTDRIRPRQHRADSPGTVTVGFVGTLKPWHGTEILLDAFARAEGNIRLTIAGTGPEQTALQERAAALGIAERTRFLGAIAPAEIPQILRGFDIATAPYPQAGIYFSPLKVYEYMAAGLPTIASAAGELPELLTPQGEAPAGLLVSPGDVQQLTIAIERLAADVDLRDRMGGVARERVLAEHTWLALVADLFDQAGVTAP